ncbi:DUF6220 domain-containing protein [Gracilibacillus alcaliphilus]|uniref:DUF6220 domain-containing protein n=1 Tax=Gracilibacillus alcaliphilus TaxID=1401441 RepID=UPI0019588533|nr:DUF6220 domain-containing protein [Gracilibacillus alcaliphilus]MBM7676324.1 peptidoglycan/LPS O-acetylase OafA/YrhL [Gracilibacillus alcaliphilus]
MRIQFARFVFYTLLIVFTTAIVIQFILAGMAVFMDPSQWRNHTLFVHLFGFNLPVLLLITAWLANMPLKVYGQLIGLMGLIFLLYFTANMAGMLPWIGALHPIAGVLLLLLAGMILADQIKSKQGEKIQ